MPLDVDYIVVAVVEVVGVVQMELGQVVLLLQIIHLMGLVTVHRTIPY